MWTVLAADDTERMDRCAAIMRRMDGAYASLSGAYLAYRICAEGVEVHHYSAEGMEGVMMFHFHARKAQWRVWTTGFVGRDDAMEWCRLGMARLGDFMTRHHVEEVVAVRRLFLDHPTLERGYDIVPSHEDFDVTVLHVMRDCVVWRITRAKSCLASIPESEFTERGVR